MFSKVALRLPAEKNPLYQIRDRLLAEGRAVTDLVSGNVTEHGLAFPEAPAAEILARSARRSSIYRPDSFGQVAAREAVSEYYRARRGLEIPPDRLLLTPGTSVAYAYAFKLLADEGDEILCPQPSYPLFDYIAALCGVRMIPYRLEERAGWRFDPERLEACVSTRTRAAVLISPHNPTGHVATAGEVQALAEIARRHSLALIADEVFSEFLFAGTGLPSPAACNAPLVLTLNGFSKMFALPGWKLGWMGITGDDDRVRQALRSLELIADTFLPVSEPVQGAVAEVFERGGPFLAAYRDAVRERWAAVRDVLATCRSCSRTDPDGGFYVTLGLAHADEESAARKILEEERILIHPGYYYDMAPHHLVMSFVQEPAVSRDAVGRMIAALERCAL